MLKKFIALLFVCYATFAMAAVDVNKATQAELTEIKGIGPATSTVILEARKQGPFKNWDDLIARVKGIASTSAAKLSAGGLTVNGQAFKPADKTPTARNTDEKPAKPTQTAGKKQEKS